MDDLIILKCALHKIDIEASKPIEIALDINAEGLKQYTMLVLHELLESSRSRYFEFLANEELTSSILSIPSIPSVPSMLSSMVDDDCEWDRCSSLIANKLYEVEVLVQEKIQRLTNIRAGCLLQIKLSHADRISFIIVKIDHSDFLDESDLTIKSGLPTSKTRLQKAAIISLGEEKEIKDVVISDSKPTITEYWYLHFLVARQLTDSKHNTKSAFNAIDKLLKDEVKNVSPADYWFIRNDVVSYFRNEDSLVFDELVEKIEKHTIESKDLIPKFDSFIESFKKLPKSTRMPFDTQFDLDTGVIKTRINRKVVLDDNFELRINGEVDDLRSKVKASEDDGGKYIKIYSDKGYEEFKTGGGH
ncbi:nucleoid-associated protein [Cobetia amphilecti]|uniref:nucleoid-associated protein n=1 Tax=Cobetia amphilecti TaxID=1055104 RepID=UPI001C08D6AB|nr:nucleoid-associated protein [Cobetia amphilecti]MBU3007314.1 nucleoid-associated protein [Cobetia amphilecti]